MTHQYTRALTALVLTVSSMLVPLGAAPTRRAPSTILVDGSKHLGALHIDVRDQIVVISNAPGAVSVTVEGPNGASLSRGFIATFTDSQGRLIDANSRKPLPPNYRPVVVFVSGARGHTVVVIEYTDPVSKQVVKNRIAVVAH